MNEPLSGRYRLEERVGDGGFANVYRAEDLTLERTVAVKVLAEHLSDDERMVRRFRLEAMAVARLIHPNIVQVYDTGVTEGRHYIVMEYVDDGTSCATLLEGPLPPHDQALAIILDAAGGLDYAHRKRIVHRDVKPSNLMIAWEPDQIVARVSDFGIARALDQRPLTARELAVGTRGYLCPEAWRSEEPTPKFDVYALGVVAHELLIGGLPVRDRGGGIHLPPEREVGETVKSLVPVLEHALHDDPAQRFESCFAFAQELRGSLAS